MSAQKSAVRTAPNVGALALKVHANPTQEEFQALALAHTPNMMRTGNGSMNKVASIAKARSAGNTYVLTDDAGKHTCKTMAPADAQKYIDAQDAYIARHELVRVDGYVGNHPETRVRTTLWMTIEGANVAAMQQILYFPPDRAELATWEPEFQVIYTPGCPAEGQDKDRAILVDIDRYVTRILGSDYFGESKKGGLRMLNAKVFRDGGLVLHAGAKLTPVRGADGKISQKLIVVMGESGTGKTTSTFSPQGNAEVGFSKSIQDDMVMLFPGGRAYATENGCFAIAHRLREETEPIIYRGAIAPNAWLENVYQDTKGGMDFHKAELSPQEVQPLHDVLLASGVAADDLAKYEAGEATYAWSKNSRVIIPMSDIETAGDSLHLPATAAIGVLNRNTNIIPGVVRFRNAAQAAAYFMLGETMGTAASGSDAGKAKRSPFTNPFFPLRNEQMANRYMELADTMPGVFNFMMNTGWVGGDDADEKAGRALKVKIRHSSAILQALADGTIEW
ncbi:MAG: phosphoenolpyruvate carboxykinase domain-containing protein, partial [Candidatus Eisenbacteria bacterium]